MIAVMIFKYFGLLSILILLFGLMFITMKWPRGKQYTFSQHVALRRSSIIYYVLLFSLSLPFLLYFFVYWFVPTYHLSSWVLFFIITSSVAQWICTLIPETGGKKSIAHQGFAGISAILLLPVLGVIISSASVSFTQRIVTIICLFIMITCFTLTILFRAVRDAYAFILQSVYFASFFLPILVISYL